MARKGPAPKPTALKKLEGTYRKDRAAGNEPQPRVMLPSPPKWLSAEARKVYRRLGKLLVQVGVMSELDATALALLAHEWARWREASAVAQTEGMVQQTPNGAWVQHPAVGIANRAAKNVFSLLIEFGMTPASRTRVSAQLPEDDGDLAAALFRSIR